MDKEKRKEYKRQKRIKKERLKRLWKDATPAEKKLRDILTKLNIQNLFQRTFRINGRLFIADFFLPKRRIVIEVDGIQHSIDQKQVEYDKRRTEFLESKRGVKVVRFTNSEVLETPDFVFDQLESIVK